MMTSEVQAVLKIQTVQLDDVLIVAVWILNCVWNGEKERCAQCDWADVQKGNVVAQYGVRVDKCAVWM